MNKKFLAYITILLIAISVVFPLALPVRAVAPVCKEATTNIAAVDTAIVFGTGSFQHVIIKTSTTAAIVYISPNNTTATVADFQVDPGGSLSLGLAGGAGTLPAMTGFHYLGASATGTISYVAW